MVLSTDDIVKPRVKEFVLLTTKYDTNFSSPSGGQARANYAASVWKERTVEPDRTSTGPTWTEQ